MPDHGDVFQRFVDWIDTTKGIHDLELTTLKGHLMVEDALRYLLAAKLRPRKDPEPVAAKIDIRPFEQFARLALVDEEDEHALRNAVVVLHQARNKMSHSMNHPEFTAKLEDFVRQMHALEGIQFKWPTTREGNPPAFDERWTLPSVAFCGAACCTTTDHLLLS